MSDWNLEHNGFDPASEPLREALCTLGNGHFASRGAAPEENADAVHCPGTARHTLPALPFASLCA
jgi:trehalose/maltose hydrolase-like predicted phosphorylase